MNKSASVHRMRNMGSPYLGLLSSSRSGRIDNDLRYVAIENLSRVSLCLTIVVIDLDRLIDISDYVTSRGTK